MRGCLYFWLITHLDQSQCVGFLSTSMPHSFISCVLYALFVFDFYDRLRLENNIVGDETYFTSFFYTNNAILSKVAL